ncbi:hypothetical protein PMAN_b0224 [Pseudoalteromonas marina]|nr:hypothetical protein PMAN_b0224 [Pseudoalteromonas marina]
MHSFVIVDGKLFNMTYQLTFSEIFLEHAFSYNAVINGTK